MGQNENGESEQPSSSDVGPSLALRKMMDEETETKFINNVWLKMEPMVINTVQQVIERVAEDSLRVVKEEIQSAVKKALAGGSRNDELKERSLHLKFVVEVSGPVQTSNELKGIRGDPVEVALFDATGHIVNCGPESSAKVEIVLIDDDDENSMTHENFERKIIKAGDKKKPYLAGNVYICLKGGVANLIGVKLGHGKDWTNFCNCRLGVRLVQNFRGIIVQEAWTEPFKVVDKRGKQYDKHHPPFPSSDVWRLEKIARKGGPCNRLNNKNIKNVQDFLFWHHVNPEELQLKILQVGDSVWNTIVAHACTCTIDDKKMYSHRSPTGPPMSVIYDAVGKLKGVIDESHFFPIDNLSADKKDLAHNLHSSLLEPSAFVERYNTPFNDDDFRQQQHPYDSSHINASTNCSIQSYSNHNEGSTPLSIIPNSIYDSRSSDSLGSRDTGELWDPLSCLLPDPENIDGDPPTDLDKETSTLLEKHKADAQELSPPFNDMNHLHQLWTGSGTYVEDFAGGRSSEMVGECSNASFYSVSSTIHSFEETGGYYLEYNDLWGTPGPAIMYSYNTQMCDHRNEPRADQGSTATALEPQPVNTSASASTNPPNRWKRLSRLWLSFREKMSLDVTRIHKKRKLG